MGAGLAGLPLLLQQLDELRSGHVDGADRVPEGLDLVRVGEGHLAGREVRPDTAGIHDADVGLQRRFRVDGVECHVGEEAVQ